MKIELKDVIHFYLGCDALIISHDEWIGKIISVDSAGGCTVVLRNDKTRHQFSGTVDGCKPILRPLSDMTEEESKILGEFSSTDTVIPCPHFNNIHKVKHGLQLVYLLKQGFDLFDLISTGQAISKPSTPSI